jgi:hypothetical protein
MEISDWLKVNKGVCSGYCILDDDPEAFGGRPGVLVAGMKGLTTEDAAMAIEILGVAGSPGVAA